MPGQEKKKSRKAGRNKVRCQRYRAKNQREKNKARRLWKHVRRLPKDMCAWTAFHNEHYHNLGRNVALWTFLPPSAREEYQKRAPVITIN